MRTRDKTPQDLVVARGFEPANKTISVVDLFWQALDLGGSATICAVDAML
jgi:hypothetical protein